MRYVILLPVVFSVACVQAQNLVPNPSFEEYSTCPTNISQIDYAVGWSSLSGSSDYFNACADDSMGVPSNLFGYQQAATGQAYAGVQNFIVGVPYYRENLWVQLTSPMAIGASYYLSMKVSPGGFGNANYSSRWSSSGIGMRLSTIPLAPGGYQDNHPLMSLGQVLQDTAVWTTVSSSFVTDSAYQYLLIGCFWEDSFLDTVLTDPSADTDGAYAFVDDVCISDQLGVCQLAQGVHDEALSRSVVSVFSQSDQIVVRIVGTKYLPAELNIIDLAGRVRYKALMQTEEARFSVSPLSSGLYILALTTPIGRLHPVSFIHTNP